MPRIALADLPERYQRQASTQLEARKQPSKPQSGQLRVEVAPLEPKALETAKNGEIRLVLPYPPSTNTAWRSIVIKGQSRVLLSKEGRIYKQEVAAICAKAGIVPLVGPVSFRAFVYRPRKAGDLSNRIKVLEDALEGFAYENDNQIVHLDWWRFDDKVSPRVEVTIRSV